MGELYDSLTDLAVSGRYPFHMPGHKRRLTGDFGIFNEIAKIDVTEIEGFDNLHAPSGVIKREQERAASVFGAKESFFLVGGSSAGVMAAICSQTKQGETLLMSRNSHRSAYHAAYLNGLRTVYLYPPQLFLQEPGQQPEGENGAFYGIAGPIRPADVEAAMKKSDAKAVCIVSPTYEGVISDIRGIADVVHQRGGILIVDEAHGAHLHVLHQFTESEQGRKYQGLFPDSATLQGADIVIQSLHKTLPALTQTAILHICSDRVDPGKLRRDLAVLQSSSPSYVLMASISKCLDFLSGCLQKKLEGNRMRADLSGYCKRLTEFYQAAGELGHIRILTAGPVRGFGGDFDPSKLVFYFGEALLQGTEKLSGLDGFALAGELLKTDRLDLEMATPRHALAMTSVMDTQEGFDRLLAALKRIDGTLMPAKTTHATVRKEKSGMSGAHFSGPGEMTIRDAWDRESELVAEELAEGRICGEFISLYPPGVPLIVPGEKLTKESMEAILTAAMACPNLQRESPAGLIRCVV